MQLAAADQAAFPIARRNASRNQNLSGSAFPADANRWHGHQGRCRSQSGHAGYDLAGCRLRSSESISTIPRANWSRSRPSLPLAATSFLRGQTLARVSVRATAGQKHTCVIVAMGSGRADDDCEGTGARAAARTISSAARRRRVDSGATPRRPAPHRAVPMRDHHGSRRQSPR